VVSHGSTSGSERGDRRAKKKRKRVQWGEDRKKIQSKLPVKKKPKTLHKDIGGNASTDGHDWGGGSWTNQCFKKSATTPKGGRERKKQRGDGVSSLPNEKKKGCWIQLCHRIGPRSRPHGGNGKYRKKKTRPKKPQTDREKEESYDRIGFLPTFLVLSFQKRGERPSLLMSRTRKLRPYIPF